MHKITYTYYDGDIKDERIMYMITVNHEVIRNIPSLIVVNNKQVDEPLPLVVYFHGFTSAKEHNLPFAYLLAQKGYRVVLPDSKFHGEREKNTSETKRQLSFWDIVLENVNELQHIKEYFENKRLISNSRIGIAGTSMGGITTSAALTAYEWIDVAGILMGSPKITLYAQQLIDHVGKHIKLPPEKEIKQLVQSLEAYDLSKHIDTLNDRPLFLWHGEDDTIVPFDHSYNFYKEARKAYKKKRHIQFLKESDRDHKVSRQAIINTVDWFTKHL